MVQSSGVGNKEGLDEEMHVYGRVGCKAKREAKKDLVGSG